MIWGREKSVVPSGNLTNIFQNTASYCTDWDIADSWLSQLNFLVFTTLYTQMGDTNSLYLPTCDRIWITLHRYIGPVYTMKAYRGSGQPQAPAALLPRNATGIHWIAGWLGIRVQLDVWIWEKIFAPGRIRTPDRSACVLVVIPTTRNCTGRSVSVSVRLVLG